MHIIGCTQSCDITGHLSLVTEASVLEKCTLSPG